MNKLIVSLLLLVSASLISFTAIQSSSVDVKWGEPIKFKGREYFVDFVCKADDGYVMLKWKKKNPVLVLYNKKLNPVKEVELPLKDAARKYDFEKVRVFGDQLIFMKTYINKDQKRNEIYFQMIDRESLTLSSNVEYLDYMDYTSNRSKGDFSVQFSKDESKMLVFMSLPKDKRSSRKEDVAYKIYDSEMDEMNEDEINFPSSNNTEVVSYKVSNEGDLFMMTTRQRGSDSRKNDNPWNYYINAYYSDGTDEEIELELESGKIRDITMEFNDDGQIVLSGMYSLKGSSGVKGTFFKKINKEDLDIVAENEDEFEDEFITQGWTEREIKKSKRKQKRKNTELQEYDYVIRDLVYDEKGNTTMLAEQFYIKVVTTTSTDANGVTTTSTTYYYYYNDIIAVQFDKDGAVNWKNKIEKYQVSTNDGGRKSSFSTQVFGDRIAMVYNENATQFYEREERNNLTGKEKRSSLLIMALLEPDGEVSKEIIFNNREEETYAIPKLSEQIDEDKMIVYAEKPKMSLFGGKSISKFALLHFN